MQKTPGYLSVAVLLAGLGLAACTAGNQDNPPAPTAAPGATNSPAGMNVPLTSSQVKISMQLQGSPQVGADGKSLIAAVQLDNQGSTVLVSKGTYPVTLGAHAADARGEIVVNDLARADIPVTPPGGHAAINIALPLDQSLGHLIQILPVQEAVNWFDQFGVKPLVLGPFQQCADPGRICGPDGAALTVQSAPSSPPAAPAASPRS